MLLLMAKFRNTIYAWWILKINDHHAKRKSLIDKQLLIKKCMALSLGNANSIYRCKIIFHIATFDYFLIGFAVH